MNSRYLILALVMFPLLTLATNPTSLLENQLEAIQTFAADFTQIIESSEGEQQTQKGTLVFARSNKLYWKTEPPENREIVLDKGKLFIYDIDLEQVTVKYYDANDANHGLIGLLNDYKNLKKNYNIKHLEQLPYQHYQLTPKDEQSQLDFEKIDFYFKKGILSKLKFLNHFSQVITLTFKKIKINQSLKDEFFNFEPPQGVDVLYE